LAGSGRKEDEGSARQLLIRCLELLDKERYPHIATSAHYMLSDIFVPDDIDPRGVNDEASDVSETSNLKKFEQKRKLSCTAATMSSSKAVVQIQVCLEFFITALN